MSGTGGWGFNFEGGSDRFLKSSNADLMSEKRAALLLKQQHGSDITPLYLQLPYTSNSPAIFDALAWLFNGRHYVEKERSNIIDLETDLEVTHYNNPAAARVSR